MPHFGTVLYAPADTNLILVSCLHDLDRNQDPAIPDDDEDDEEGCPVLRDLRGLVALAIQQPLLVSIVSVASERMRHRADDHRRHPHVCA